MEQLQFQLLTAARQILAESNRENNNNANKMCLHKGTFLKAHKERLDLVLLTL